MKHMDIDRVTMTGPDDSSTIDQCLQMTAEFPFVEWGILVSASQEGSPRFPSRKWILDIPKGIPNLSMHLCGRWVRQLLALGVVEFPQEYIDRFRRIQLNFHDEHTPCNPKVCADALRRIGIDKQYIFQIDRTAGNRHMVAIMNEAPDLNIVPLFDVSGGAGESPDKWPSPFPRIYNGYAGGIGPDNIVAELKRIGRASWGSRIWIDMETKVRSDNDRLFDFNKVGMVLAECKPYIEKAPGFELVD